MVEKKYLLVGAAAAGLVLAYMVYRGAGAAAEAVGDAAQAINPMNNDNVINQGATSFYRFLTGSDGTIGTDIYDVVHGGVFDPTSENNIVYRQFSPETKTTLENTVGKGIYDAEQWIKNLWSK